MGLVKKVDLNKRLKDMCIKCLKELVEWLFGGRLIVPGHKQITKQRHTWQVYTSSRALRSWDGTISSFYIEKEASVHPICHVLACSG